MQIENPRQLGALLKDGRKKARFTQKELARRIQASVRWVQLAENGSAGTGVGLLLRALAAVGVTLEVILDGNPGDVSPVAAVDVDRIVAQAGTPPRRTGEGTYGARAPGGHRQRPTDGPPRAHRPAGHPDQVRGRPSL